MAENGSPWKKEAYLIAQNGSYFISAICRCNVGSPQWEYFTAGLTRATKIDESSTSDVYCEHNGMKCNETCYGNIKYIQDEDKKEGLSVFRNLTNFPIKETTILYCRNSDYNYAPAIAIVISPSPPIGKIKIVN